MTRKDIPQIGSPVYHIDVPANIAAGASKTFDLDSNIDVYKKYLPFDFIEILNTNADSYELILNHDHHFAIPASASIVKADLPFRQFTIHNTSGNVLDKDKMYISIQHTPLDADKVARNPKGLLDYIPLAGFLMR